MNRTKKKIEQIKKKVEMQKRKRETTKKPSSSSKKNESLKKRKPIIILSSSTTSTRSKKIKKNDTKRSSQRTTISEEMKLSKEIQSLTTTNNLKKSPQNIITMPQNEIRYNEKFIELMEKLAAIMSKQGESFRARAYQKAQETIMTYPGDIKSPNDLKGQPNIGSTIMEKLNEYVETGTLKILEREKNNPINILTNVYGIGPKKAKELVEKGITNIPQLRENQHLLNDVQKVGLQYYEDILERIPRSEIEEYRDYFEKGFLKASKEEKGNNEKMEIVGSYRRGAQSSGDIDVIITSSNPKIFTKFIDYLIEEKIILHVLSRGPTKCLVITKIQNALGKARRVDFLYTTPEEFPFAILYFTGSKIFNTIMRNNALKMGLTMNEHGLYKLSGDNKKVKEEKVQHEFTSEKDIFEYLNLEYKRPEERIDGRAIIIKENQQIQEVASEKNVKIEEPIPIIKVPKAPKTKTQKANKPQAKIAEKKALKIESEPTDQLFEKIKNDIANFKKNGIQTLNSLTEEELTNMLNYANTMYRNFQSIMTDNEYDILEDYIKEKYPNNEAIKQIGAPPTKNKVTLPYFMGSMDKIKPDTNALTNWKTKYKGPYVLSCKLDGVSGLYTTEGNVPHLYTRGDGKVGQDISYLIPYMRLPKNKNLVIRGEFIIPKIIFETKYKTKFANGRNMVSGIVNQKSVNQDIIKDVDFVSYELIKPLVKPSEQFGMLQKLDINVVQHKFINESQLTNELLSDTLTKWRQNYEYEIDGIIVTNDEIYPERKAGNPEHSFAFKMVLSDQIAEAKVVDVIWTPSKDGYLKPRVQIEPITLGGVRIEYATGFNGQFINDNKVGIGAVIELIRSGDVIPHIRKVTTPATEAKMPQIPYKWNETHVDVILEDIESDEVVKAKNITGFFKGIEVDGLSYGNIQRIINAGYDSVSKILQMTTDDFLKVEGFKQKTAEKLFNNIKSQIQKASLVNIMSASNIFGRGFSDKKLELILESYPNVLQSQDTNKVAKVAAIKGMATKTAEAFVEKIPAFLAFLQEANLESKLQQQSQSQSQQGKETKDESHPLYNKTIVFTGFRDKQLEEQLKTYGSKLGSSVSKNTFVVIVKEKPIEESGKVLDAKKLGIPIMTLEEFKTTYHN
jgi:NAD-dependent DNA ligase